VINTNVAALNAQRSLGSTQANLEKAIQRLSTGFRINSAADDAAGLAITDRMTAQIRGLNQATRNANDGVSTLQTADSSLQQVTDLLQRARELSVQSANDSNNSSDRLSLQSEVVSIVSELDRVANTVSFNGKKLLDGTFSNAQFQVGANANQIIAFSIASVKTNDLGAKVEQGYAVSSTALAGLTTNSTMTIDGFSVTIGQALNNSIDSVINNVNARASDTKATAFKNTQTVVYDTTGTGTIAAGSSATLTVNNVTISLTTANAGVVADFVSTLNQYSNQTGVVVATGAIGFVYTRANGGDISFLETSGSTAVGDTTASTDARTFNAGFSLSVGLNDTITVVTNSTATAVGFATGFAGFPTTTSKIINSLNISTATGANDAIQTLDFVLTQIGRVRGDVGAVQNRFTSAIQGLQVASENISAARSRIKDADVAHETAELTRNQILTQAGVSVLAQANQLPQAALSLLGGR
jgi:flagellin